MEKTWYCPHCGESLPEGTEAEYSTCQETGEMSAYVDATCEDCGEPVSITVDAAEPPKSNPTAKGWLMVHVGEDKDRQRRFLRDWLSWTMATMAKELSIGELREEIKSGTFHIPDNLTVDDLADLGWGNHEAVRSFEIFDSIA